MQGATALILAFAFSRTAIANEIPGLERELYGKFFQPVKTIGLVMVHSYRSGGAKNSEAKMQIAETDEGKSSHLRARLVDLFPGVPYSSKPPLSRHRDTSIAYLLCDTWLHGEEWPIAYHVECRLGAGAKARVLTGAALGVTSPEKESEDVSQQLDKIVERLARKFSLARESQP